MLKEFLKNKGWIGTILGTIQGLPVGARITIKYFRNATFSNQELITAAVLLGLAMVWVILPSRVEFTAGKMSFKVED